MKNGTLYYIFVWIKKWSESKNVQVCRQLNKILQHRKVRQDLKKGIFDILFDFLSLKICRFFFHGI